MEAFDNEILAAILEEADEVFCYDRTVRPQDRAHAYLGRHALGRDYQDTAMQVAVRDMVYRAFSAGMQQGCEEADEDTLKEIASAIGDAYEALMEAIEGREDR